MPYQITETDRKDLIQKLGSCKRTIYRTDARASDLIEVLIRLLESDDENRLDEFLKSIYPLVKQFF